MKIEVTEDDISNGLTKSYTHDALSRALRRAFNKRFKVSHSYNVIIPCADYAFVNKCMIELPHVAQEFIKTVDRKPKEARPMSFSIPDPPHDLFTRPEPTRT